MDATPLYGSLSEGEFTQIKDYIVACCGIYIAPEKAYLIETKLSKLMIDAGAETFGEFYTILAEKNDPILRQKIINAITINETLWFRDVLPWECLEEVILPKWVDELAKGKRKKVRVWSAATSTGPEIYSTVMCIDNYLKNNNIKNVSLEQFEFFATDISTRVLEIAKTGRYDNISINRGLDAYYKERYFTPQALAWNIDPNIRNAVKFQHFNLQNSFVPFGAFDIIFCRYVLIYFSNELKREIIEKMQNSLTENGVLFTGNYVLYNYFVNHFNVNHYKNVTYYSKKVVMA